MTEEEYLERKFGKGWEERRDAEYNEAEEEV